MIVEENGLILMPGNGGADCPANGLGVTSSGEHIECCCDECDYGMCCYAPWYGNPCEECGAYHYVNELPLPEKVAQKEAMEAAKAAAATPVPKAAYAGGETIVYYGDKSKYYHANSGCRTITSAAPHTLQEAVDAGKQNCPQCAAPLLEQ